MKQSGSGGSKSETLTGQANSWSWPETRISFAVAVMRVDDFDSHDL